MSQIKQVEPNHWIGPEDAGYQPHFYNTENAVKNYPLGRYVREDSLQPCNRKIELDYGANDPKHAKLSEEEKRLGFLVGIFQLMTAGKHEYFIDMRVSSLMYRGKWVFAAFFYGAIYACIILGLSNYSHNFPDGFTLYNVIAFSLFCLLILWGLFHSIPTPVRFHQGNQEVYVWHKDVLYRIPWGECEISVRVDQTHLGYGHLSDGYELVLWLNPKHATNKNLMGQKHQRLSLMSVGRRHQGCYYYWEYLRRYMDDHHSSYVESHKEPLRGEIHYKNMLKWGPFSMIFYIIALLVMLLYCPRELTLMSAPFRRKWPKEVHEWTGKKCDWF